MNLLLLGYNIGQRSDNLYQYQVGCFKAGVTSDGQAYMEVRHGRMKNFQACAANAGKGPHVQTVLQHENPKLDAVAAYQRQVAMLGDKAAEDSPLFRSMGPCTKKIPDKGAKYATCKGVAEWVSKTIRPGLTFRDCARRAVVSKLANDPRLTTTVVADFMRMTERNVARYYRGNQNKRRLAAQVLAEVFLCRRDAVAWSIFPFPSPRPKLSTLMPRRFPKKKLPMRQTLMMTSRSKPKRYARLCPISPHF